MRNKPFSLFTALLLIFTLMMGLLPIAQAEGGMVSGVVFNDKNGNGINEDERGLNNVKVTLQKMLPDGKAEDLFFVDTERDGSYAIVIPENGEYRLFFTLAYEYRFTRHGLDSSVMPTTDNQGATLPFTVQDGESITINAGGLTGNSYISIYAFEDKNLNGGRSGSEPKIRNVQIEVYYQFEGKDYLIAQTQTNKEGEANISYLAPGPYYVKAILPENYVAGPLGDKISSFYNCMYPSTDEICYSVPVELPAKGGVAMGVGVVTTGSLSGSVWQDDNGNQLRDANEGGCIDAKVTAYSAALNITREAALSSDGTFTITGLQPADYELIYTLPDGMIFADSSDSALQDIATQSQLNVNVIAEKNTVISPVGATAASSVQVSVCETNEEEVLPLPGVEARLVQNGKEVCTAVSDADGILLFPIARCGEATVNIVLPDGYVVAKDSGAFPYANGINTPSFTLSVPHLDTGYAEGFAVKSASVSGLLAEDPTNTGLIAADSTPLPGYTVQVIDAENQVAFETVTDETGAYAIENIVPGEYSVRFLLDDRYIASPYFADEDSTCNSIVFQEPLFGETDVFVLSADQHKQNVNGALFKAGIVDGYVLLNSAYDGLSTHEGGAENVRVTLLDENNTPWQDYAYDITDANGYFCIKGILPGTYSLQYERPENSAFVAPHVPENTWNSSTFTIVNGSEIRVDAVGTVLTATLGGTVSDYTTSAGVSAALTMTNQRTGEVFSVNTDENGQYVFEHLLPDQYLLQVQLADGYLFADSPASTFPYLNESSSSAMVLLPMGTVEDGFNIIASQPVNWQAQLFMDANGNNVMDADEPLASHRNVSLYLREDLIGQYTTDAYGIVRFENIIPAAYTLKIALNDNEILVATPNEDSVTIDRDGAVIALLPYSDIQGQVWSLDGTLNGVNGLKISLVQDGQVIATAITDENGAYAFEKLLRGDYQLRAELQDGYLFARMQDITQRNSYILSQMDGSRLYGLISLALGQSYTGADIGMGGMGGIGDYAWIDLNQNGMQDIGEPALPGIEISLYQYGVCVATTTTDVHGRYAFTGLYPGAYQMQVTMPKEVKPTIQQTDYPIVASILPQGNEATVTVEEVIVPSNGKNINLDLGFVLKKKNVYPASIDQIPQKDWSSYPHPED